MIECGAETDGPLARTRRRLDERRRGVLAVDPCRGAAGGLRGWGRSGWSQGRRSGRGGVLVHRTGFLLGQVESTGATIYASDKGYVDLANSTDYVTGAGKVIASGAANVIATGAAN